MVQQIFIPSSTLLSVQVSTCSSYTHLLQTVITFPPKRSCGGWVVKAHLSFSSRAVPPAQFIPQPANMCLALWVTNDQPEVSKTSREGFTQAGWLQEEEVRVYVKGKGLSEIASKLQFSFSVACSLGFRFLSEAPSASFSSAFGYFWGQAATSSTTAN